MAVELSLVTDDRHVREVVAREGGNKIQEQKSKRAKEQKSNTLQKHPSCQKRGSYSGRPETRG